ncbi:hypothetical protein [Thiofilum flexile]|uniref:hypothetical protein n=1 Tax=Thiofilum flexile TaxID=125627 RepID=UPI00036EFC53|nr:hypothetical protein [Thiofilum flexile]
MNLKNSDLSEINRIYQKPMKLSAPIWEYSDKFLSSLINKSLEELNGVDYGIIFNTNLPPCTFQEAAYFIPASFYYLEKSPEDSGEMLENWVSFLGLHQEKLREKNIFFIIENCLLDLLIGLTNTFKVVEFDKLKCQEKGWRLDYFVYVENSATVCELIEFLSRKRNDIKSPVFNFIDTLKKYKTDKSLKWLLEINDQISHILMYLDIDIPTDTILNELFEMGFDGGEDPLYWNRVFDRF